MQIDERAIERRSVPGATLIDVHRRRIQSKQMPTRQPDRIAMLEAEVVRLHGEAAHLERLWARKHLLGLFAVLAIPAYFLFGGVVAVVVLICTPALIATQTYLVGVRRSEVRQLIEETRRELARAKHRASPAEPALEGVLSPG